MSATFITSPSQLLSTFSLQLSETVRQAAVEQLMLALIEHMPMIYLSHSQSALIGHSDTKGLGSWTLPSGEVIYGQVAGVGRWSEVWISDD